MSEAAHRVLERADELARYTEEPGRITRPFASSAISTAKLATMEDISRFYWF